MCLGVLKITRQLRRFVLLLSLVLALALYHIQKAQAVDLMPGSGVPNLGAELQYYSDPSANLAEVLKKFKSGEFNPELKTTMKTSNYAQEAWAAVEIVNATLDDGREPDPYLATLSLALPSEVNIYVVRGDGLTENLLNYSARVPFIKENHSIARLRTSEFRIAPQEAVTLLVNFKFGPIQSFRFALETPEELEASAFFFGVIYTAFYAFGISCLLFFFGFHFGMRNWSGVFYSLLFTVALTFIAYLDGLLFRFVYPNSPQWNTVIGYALLYALSGVGFVIAGRSAKPVDGENWMSIGITSMAVFSFMGFLGTLFSPGSYLTLAAYILLGLMLISNILVSIQWRKVEGDIQIGGIIVSTLAVVLIIGVLAMTVFGGANNLILIPDATKWVFGILLLAIMISLTTHIIHLRLKHARAVEQQIVALKEEAQRSQELLESEKNYSRARDLALQRQHQLATASHDLKQPIASLRMTFDSIASNAEPKLQHRLREAFDYMEALSAGYLQDATQQKSNEAASFVEGNHEVETYALSIIIETVQQMFHEEAISKGLKIRSVSSSVLVQVPPIALMRILSNLVSNAVKYTLRGSVLIGARKAGDKVVLIVADTGPGMHSEEIERFKKTYNKGENSQGHGIGLAVCYELAADYGLDLKVASQKGKGTTFSLSIPVA